MGIIVATESPNETPAQESLEWETPEFVVMDVNKTEGRHGLGAGFPGDSVLTGDDTMS